MTVALLLRPIFSVAHPASNPGVVSTSPPVRDFSSLTQDTLDTPAETPDVNTLFCDPTLWRPAKPCGTPVQGLVDSTCTARKPFCEEMEFKWGGNQDSNNLFEHIDSLRLKKP